MRPPRRKRPEKPKVSAFTGAKIGEILKLEPDLVIGFSDIQADIARDLIRAGVEVWISNHRSVAGILAYIRRLGAMVGAAERAEAYARSAEAHIASVEAAAAALPRRPRVYFEEWDVPMISGIRWVAELIRIAGGDDVFPERAAQSLARDRIIADAGEVVQRMPDLILGSWCGKKFGRKKSPRARVGSRFRPSATASFTRSSHRSSCSPGRLHCSMVSMRSIGAWQRWRGEPGRRWVSSEGRGLALSSLLPPGEGGAQRRMREGIRTMLLRQSGGCFPHPPCGTFSRRGARG